MANEYNSYLHRIKEMFNDDKFYNKCIEAIQEGDSSFKITQKYNKKIFDLEWVEVIEGCLPNLDHIVRNPRKFITIEEDIIDISLARNISVESVKHLATHSNLIASYDKKTDMVTPSKILNTSKEETYEVYENRFIYTLLKKLYDFVNRRYDLIKQNVKDESNQVQIMVDTSYKYGLSNMQVRLDAISNMPYEEARSLNSDELTPIERVAKMHNIISGFLGSPFAKAMVGSAPVRPPITRTNAIKKEPNYKKALVLWQFIESYDKVGFEVQVVNETREMNDGLSEQYKQLMFINNMILQNLTNSRTEEGDLDSMQERAQQNVDQEGRGIAQKVVNGKPTGYRSLGGFQDVEFTGDQFPEINLNLAEVRKVYKKHQDDKTFSATEYREITSALDRVLRQNEINQLKKQDEERKRLERKQKEEEKRVLAKNLADQKREAARLKREEEAQLKAMRQQEVLRQRAEKKALAERMAKVREEERLKKEEEAKAALAAKLEAERIAAFETKKQEIIAKIREKEDISFAKELEKFDALETSAIQDLRNELTKKYQDYVEKILSDFVTGLEDVKAEELNTPIDRDTVERMMESMQKQEAKLEEKTLEFEEIKPAIFDENGVVTDFDKLPVEKGNEDEEIPVQDMNMEVEGLLSADEMANYMRALRKSQDRSNLREKRVPSFKERREAQFRERKEGLLFASSQEEASSSFAPVKEEPKAEEKPLAEEIPQEETTVPEVDEAQETPVAEVPSVNEEAPAESVEETLSEEVTPETKKVLFGGRHGGKKAGSGAQKVPSFRELQNQKKEEEAAEETPASEESVIEDIPAEEKPSEESEAAAEITEEPVYEEIPTEEVLPESSEELTSTEEPAEEMSEPMEEEPAVTETPEEVNPAAISDENKEDIPEETPVNEESEEDIPSMEETSVPEEIISEAENPSAAEEETASMVSEELPVMEETLAEEKAIDEDKENKEEVQEEALPEFEEIDVNAPLEEQIHDDSEEE